MTRSRATRTARGSTRSAAPGSRSPGQAPRSPLARSPRAGAGTATNDSARSDARRRASRNADKVQIRSLIVDDHKPFLDAARLLLEREGVSVVGVATTSAEALRLEAELRPDLVLVDIRLGEESGFELARRLSGTVILISTHAQSEYAEQIAASPAAGFIPKARLSAAAIRRLAGAPAE